MKKGIRKLTANNGGQFYIVKNKTQCVSNVSIRNNKEDVYLIINPEYAKDWHKDKIKKQLFCTNLDIDILLKYTFFMNYWLGFMAIINFEVYVQR